MLNQSQITSHQSCCFHTCPTLTYYFSCTPDFGMQIDKRVMQDLLNIHKSKVLVRQMYASFSVKQKDSKVSVQQSLYFLMTSYIFSKVINVKKSWLLFPIISYSHDGTIKKSFVVKLYSSKSIFSIQPAMKADDCKICCLTLDSSQTEMCVKFYFFLRLI